MAFVAFKSDSASQLDFILSKGLELYLCCKLLFLLEFSFLFLVVSSVTFVTDEACFIQNIIFINLLTLISNHMHLFSLLVVLFVLYQVSTQESQTIKDPPLLEEQQLEIRDNQEDVQSEGMEMVGYLRNVQNLDMLINFLYCNKTIGWDQLRNINSKMISRSRQGLKQSSEIFTCSSDNDKSVQEPEKYSCWLCMKQFKNNTYLALHYFLRHKDQFNQLKKKSQNSTGLQMILNQRLYRILGQNDLSILFSSSAPQSQVNRFCINIFSQVFQLYDTKISEQLHLRYDTFMKKKNSTQICMMIASKMFETNIWIPIGKYICLTLLVFVGVGMCGYFVTWRAEQKRKSSAEKYKMKRI